MDFSKLKNTSKNSLDQLSKMVGALNQASYATNDNLWEPELDKSGVGYAVIRFLPPAQVDGDNGVPFIRLWNHGFQHNGRWFIENCPTTIDGQCPVCEDNTRLWESGIEDNRKLVSEHRKRKLSFYSNVYIIKDPKNPENEGTVKLFRYGTKIFKKIQQVTKPEFEDDIAFDPFNLWTGANFIVKIKKNGKFNDYDSSKFDNPAPLMDDDDEMEAIWKAEHSLLEFINPTNFKSYDELKSKLNKIIGTNSLHNNVSSSKFEQQKNSKIQEQEDEFDEVFNTPSSKVKESSNSKSEKSEEDDDMDFYANLFNDED